MRPMSATATYPDLLARVQDLVATSDRVPVVAISGHGGSGKSTLAGRLGADLGLEPDQVVPTDCFYAATCGPAPMAKSISVTAGTSDTIRPGGA